MPISDKVSIIQFNFDQGNSHTARSKNRIEIANQVDNFLKEVGYPNLYVSLTDAYDGYWKVINKRTGHAIFTCFGNGSICAREEIEAGDTCIVLYFFNALITPDSLEKCAQNAIRYVETVGKISNSQSPTPYEIAKAIKHVGIKSLYKSKMYTWYKYHGYQADDSEELTHLKQLLEQLDNEIEQKLSKLVSLKQTILKFTAEEKKNKKE